MMASLPDRRNIIGEITIISSDHNFQFDNHPEKYYLPRPTFELHRLHAFP